MDCDQRVHYGGGVFYGAEKEEFGLGEFSLVILLSLTDSTFLKQLFKSVYLRRYLRHGGMFYFYNNCISSFSRIAAETVLDSGLGN